MDNTKEKVKEDFHQYHRFVMSPIPKDILQWIFNKWIENENIKSGENNDMIYYIENSRTSKGRFEYPEEKKLTKMLKKAIEDDSLDITLLFDLLTKVCKNTINLNGEFEDLNSLEQNIWKVKEFRNKLQHSILNEKTFKTFGKSENISLFEDLLVEIVNLTAKRLPVEKSECEELISKIRREKNKLLSSPIIDYEDNLLVFHKLKNNCKQIHNRMTFCTDICGENIGLQKIPNLYYNLNLEKSLSSTNGERLDSNDLFNLFNLGNVVFILGEAGAGKTFLLIQIIYEAYNKEQHFKGVQSYDLIVVFQCRNQTVKSFLDFLRNFIPEITRNSGWKSQPFEDFLKSMRVLFILDGVDEVNQNSYVFVKYLLQTFWNQNFLITGRPGSQERIDQTKIIVKILGLEEEETKLSFIEKYCPGKSLEVIQVIKRVPTLLQHLIALPLYLAFYCLSYNKGNVSNLKHPGDLIENYLELTKHKLSERLRTSPMSIKEISYRLDLLFKDYERLAWMTLFTEKLTLSDADTSDLFDSFRKLFPLNTTINSDIILSGMFSCKLSDSLLSKNTYSFPHKTIQEWYSAKYFYDDFTSKSTSVISLMVRLKNMLKSQKIKNKSIIKEFKETVITKSSSHSFDMDMWSNTLLFLIAKSVNSKDEEEVNTFLDINSDEIIETFLPGEKIKDIKEVKNVMIYSNFFIAEKVAGRMANEWKLFHQDVSIGTALLNFKMPSEVKLDFSYAQDFNDVVTFIRKIRCPCKFNIDYGIRFQNKEKRMKQKDAFEMVLKSLKQTP